MGSAVFKTVSRALVPFWVGSIPMHLRHRRSPHVLSSQSPLFHTHRGRLAGPCGVAVPTVRSTGNGTGTACRTHSAIGNKSGSRQKRGTIPSAARILRRFLQACSRRARCPSPPTRDNFPLLTWRLERSFEKGGRETLRPAILLSVGNSQPCECFAALRFTPNPFQRVTKPDAVHLFSPEHIQGRNHLGTVERWYQEARIGQGCRQIVRPM